MHVSSVSTMASMEDGSWRELEDSIAGVNERIIPMFLDVFLQEEN